MRTVKAGNFRATNSGTKTAAAIVKHYLALKAIAQKSDPERTRP